MNDLKSRLDDAGDRLNALPVWAKLLGFPVILPLAIAFSILSIGSCIVAIPCLCVWEEWDHWQLLRKLRASGRVVPWADIKGPLKGGRGTLILVQWINGLIYTAWWVPHSLPLVLEPPLLTYRQWAALALSENYELLPNADPSAKECRDRYLDPARGTAARVELPRRTLDRLPRGSLHSFIVDIPESCVVVIFGR